MYGQREWVEAGGLASYGANQAELARQAATYVDRILKGALPAELPVEPPAKFDFIVNLKTAKTLNLRTHASVLQHADEIVE
jgi:putative ABC transport system substrate-binding protein